MISLLLTACLAAASTGGRTMFQSQAKLPNATFQYRCVEDTTMNWTFVFVRAQGCALKGSNITVTTMFESDKSYHLHFSNNNMHNDGKDKRKNVRAVRSF